MLWGEVRVNEMKWFKFYGQDWLTDLKIMSMSMEDRLCFITLLCLASSSDEKGLIRKCTEDAIIRLSNIPNNPTDEHNPYERSIGCLKRYEALQIVTMHDNGDVTINAFERRQEQNFSNAERQKKYRERLKTKVKPSNESYVTPSNISNARIDKIRIDKNRLDKSIEKKVDTPSQEAELFFKCEGKYMELLDSFSKDRDRSLIENEFKKFSLYWTEPNKSGTKVRWQQQSTFEVKRRLFTWLSRSFTTSNVKKETRIL